MIADDALDLSRPDFGDFYDELPLWSAPCGLMLLDRVPLAAGTIIDDGRRIRMTCAARLR